MMTTHDKIQFINEQLRVLCDTLDLEVAVLVVEGKEDRTPIAVRWPPCDPICPHPEVCTSIVLYATSNVLNYLSKRYAKDDDK